MSRQEDVAEVSGQEIIAEVVRNMEEGVEELRYSCLAPGQYYVHLHPVDFGRLRGILPRIGSETKRALDEKLEQLNKKRLLDRLRLAKPKTYECATGSWSIDFLEDPDEELVRGEILVRSELAVSGPGQLRGGASTRVLVTRRVLSGALPDPKRTQPAVPPERPVYAVITFPGAAGAQSFEIRKDEILIGRGGPSNPVDLVLAFPFVSKLHLHLRRTPSSGQFTLENLGTYGTTVNQTPVPLGSQVQLPPRATIALGDGTVVLGFQKTG